jgi:hypothetical protein
MALALSEVFRTPTSVVYPPFKNGVYLEEAFYFFYQANQGIFAQLPYVYIPAFWTNFQIDTNFKYFKHILQAELDTAIKQYPPDTKFFTVVQHDDAVLLELPKQTLIFGACSGHIPIPLIYEDRAQILERRPKVSYEEKTIQLSFVGSETHSVRKNFRKYIEEQPMPWFVDVNELRTTFKGDRSELFLSTTLKSKFSLAPRGYGRSSFRFFEIFLLGSVPVYIWDDVEWLPYKDTLDYTEFCVSIHINDLPTLQAKLDAIPPEKYAAMIKRYTELKDYFTLFGMSKYILQYLSSHPAIDILSLPYFNGQQGLPREN